MEKRILHVYGTCFITVEAHPRNDRYFAVTRVQGHKPNGDQPPSSWLNYTARLDTFIGEFNRHWQDARDDKHLGIALVRYIREEQDRARERAEAG